MPNEALDFTGSKLYCEPFLLKTSLNAMYSLKEYPEDYSQSESKQWRKFKKALKKLAHKQLRRGKDKYEYHGKEVAW